MKKLFLLASLIMVTFMLSACSGGGGGGGSAPTGTYLHYFNKNTAGLFFYDPVTKATTTVEAGGITGGVGEFIGGTYNYANKQVTDVHQRTIVYAKGGKLYKVSLLKSGNHLPVQVSSESGASTVCNNINVIPDFANPDNSIYAYAFPGGDTVCDTADDVWKFVRLGMTASDSPIAISSTMKPLTEIRDWSTSGITGELALDHNTDSLVKCDANFNSCTAIPLSAATDTLTAGDGTSLGVDINAKKMYLSVFDKTASEYQVRTYDTTSNLLSEPVYTTSNELVEGLQNSSAILFGETPSSLKLISFATNTQVVHLLTEVTVRGAALTDNRIVYVTYEDLLTTGTSTAYFLKSTTLTSSPTTTILAQTASDTEELQLAAVTGSSVLYNRLYPAYVYAAGYVKDDGTGKHEVGDARWTAASFSSILKVPSGKADLARAIMSMSTTGEIISFDPATYSASSTGLSLGTLPWSPSEFYGVGFGSNILGISFDPAWSYMADVFSVNVNVGGSLYRVTNTADDEVL